MNKRTLFIFGLLFILTGCGNDLKESKELVSAKPKVETSAPTETIEISEGSQAEKGDSKTPILNFVKDYFNELGHEGGFILNKKEDRLSIVADFNSYFPSPFWDIGMCHQGECYLPIKEFGSLKKLEDQLKDGFGINGMDFYYSGENVKGRLHVYSQGKYINKETLIEGVSKDGDYAKLDLASVSGLAVDQLLASGEDSFVEPLVQNMKLGYAKGQFCEEGNEIFQKECCSCERNICHISVENNSCVERVKNGRHSSLTLEFKAIDPSQIQYSDRVEIEEGVFLYAKKINYAEEDLARFELEYPKDDLKRANYLAFYYLDEKTGAEKLVQEIKSNNSPSFMWLEGFYYTPEMKGMLVIYSDVFLGYGWYTPSVKVLSQQILDEKLAELHRGIEELS